MLPRLSGQIRRGLDEMTRSTPIAAAAAMGLAAALLTTTQPAHASGPAGQVLAWGYNAQGELGDGTTSNRATPVNPSTPAGVTFTAVAAGAHHSLAVTSIGGVMAWGYNVNGQLGDGTNAKRTAPGG